MKYSVFCISMFFFLGGEGVLRRLEGHEENREVSHTIDTSEENMKRIAKSMGVGCTHCHIAQKQNGETDFEASSLLKDTAIHMKINFVDSLRMKNGEALNCMTCHNGEHRFLPRDVSKAKPSSLVASGMSRKEILKIMSTIKKDLGVTCDFCHLRTDDGRLDHIRPTKHKLMAKYMMEHFTGKFVTVSGKPVTCFTCHQGKAEFLPRSNP